MGLAGIDHAFELSVGQQAVGNDGGRQMRPIAGFRRRDRGHGGRLHQPRRMRRRSGNTDRLKSVSFIERLGDPSALRRRPVHGLIGEFDGGGFNDRRSGPAWRSSRWAADLWPPSAPRLARSRVLRSEPACTAVRAGTSLVTQSSRMAVSFAVPGEAGNAVGSSAGMRSMTVRRVSALVPWRA